jgi:hypothetical protein
LFFNKKKISEFPEEFSFHGYLDNPRDYAKLKICKGWFVSKKPFKMVELFLGNKKLAELEVNVIREDVDNVMPGYAFMIRKGFECVIPDAILTELKNKTRTLFIRFYIDGKRYIDKFHTKVRL